MAAAPDGLRIIDGHDAPWLASARELFVEYANSLDFSLCFQGFDEELNTLPGAYAPPRGRLLIALVNDQAAGCVALRPMTDEACEMKRLYVRPTFRGLGLGRKLAIELLRQARVAGYREMRLDTIEEKMTHAVAIYRELGFVEIEPGPAATPPHTLFMRIDLTGALSGDSSLRARL